MCLCKCARVSACKSVSVRVRTPGRAICDEGIPKQSRAAGGAAQTLQFLPTHRDLELCRTWLQTLPAECWLRIVEVQVKAKPLNRSLRQSHSRAFLGQPPRGDLGRRAGRGRRRAGPGSPACPFNPAAGREHVSGAPGGTRAPPPPKQLYFERCLWPAARRLGSTVRLASLLLILFLLRSPLPFIRPRLEVGIPPTPTPPPPPQAHTHSSHLNPGAGTQKTSSPGGAHLVQEARESSPSPSVFPVPLPPAPATRGGAVPPTARPLPALSARPGPGRLPILPWLFDCPRRYLFSLSLFLFLALRARSGGEEEEEFFPRLTFQGTQFTPSLFPFQAVSEVLPVTATPDLKRREKPPNSKSPFPSSLSSSSRYLHRHLHLRHPPTAAAATSSASFSPPPPPLFSLFGSLWTSGVDGGSGGSISSSSPRSTSALAPVPHSPAPITHSPERCWADWGRRRRSGCSGGSGGGRQDERTR